MPNYTQELGFVKQLVGENNLTWGNVLNTQLIELIDQALAGQADITVTIANQTISLANGSPSQGRAMFLDVVGTPATPRTVFVPRRQKLYVVRNGSTQTLTVSTATGTGTTLAVGEVALLGVNRALDRVEKVVIGGATVVEGPATFTELACVAENRVVGDSVITYRTMTEGTLTALRTDGFSVVVAGTDFIVRRATGTFEQPPETQARQLYVREEGVLIPAYVQVEGGKLVFRRSDGDPWTSFAMKLVYAHEILHSTVSI